MESKMGIENILSEREVDNLMKAMDKIAEEYEKEEKETIEKIKEEIKSTKTIEEILKAIFKRATFIYVRINGENYSMNLRIRNSKKNVKIVRADTLSAKDFELVIDIENRKV